MNTWQYIYIYTFDKYTLLHTENVGYIYVKVLNDKDTKKV